MELGPAYDEAREAAEQGRYAEAEAQLVALLARDPQQPPAQRALARLRLLQAKVDPPADPAQAVALAQTLATLTGAPRLQGADEGPRLDRAVELVLAVADRLPYGARATAARVLWQAGCYERAQALGGPLELAALTVAAGAPAGLLRQLAKVETDTDRLGLLEAHEAWGRDLERAAAAHPLSRSPARSPGPIRLGFLSSDLRAHVVAYFVQPLFEFIDSRFELYIYSSITGPADAAQQWFEAQAKAARRLPADDREAAQLIAGDDLDMLIDLAGPTSAGRAGVLAYKPARRQAAWLGYPHSLGLAAVDHFIVDPFLAPRVDLLLEAPLAMPFSWICMAPSAFQPQPPVAQPAPVARNGVVTFGTANDPYKFNPRLLAAWAAILAATPGSRLVIARPEAGSACFQENIGRNFAAGGVTLDRLDFRPIRGAVRRVYDDIDVALDTFPVTGGTTTCDAVWMGAPVVTLGGPAVYERLSWSILHNLGLAELCAESVEDYVHVAVELAADPARIGALRASLRDRVAAGALGHPARFAADFYAMIAGAVAQAE